MPEQAKPDGTNPPASGGLDSGDISSQVGDEEFRPLQGLTSTEAAERLCRFGPNLLPTRRPLLVWRQLASQMVNFFALMLWVAGGFSILAGMPQLGVAIFVVILVNGIFAFAQEYRAERASEKLRDLLPLACWLSARCPSGTDCRHPGPR